MSVINSAACCQHVTQKNIHAHDSLKGLNFVIMCITKLSAQDTILQCAEFAAGTNFTEKKIPGRGSQAHARYSVQSYGVANGLEKSTA